MLPMNRVLNRTNELLLILARGTYDAEYSVTEDWHLRRAVRWCSILFDNKVLNRSIRYTYPFQLQVLIDK